MCVWAAVRFSRELPLTSLICTMFVCLSFEALAPQYTHTCEFLLAQATSIRFQRKSEHWSFHLREVMESSLLFSRLANSKLSMVNYRYAN